MKKLTGVDLDRAVQVWLDKRIKECVSQARYRALCCAVGDKILLRRACSQACSVAKEERN